MSSTTDATLDEMSYPDWRERLERAKRESWAGAGITLDDYIASRRRRKQRGDGE